MQKCLLCSTESCGGDDYLLGTIKIMLCSNHHNEFVIKKYIRKFNNTTNVFTELGRKKLTKIMEENIKFSEKIISQIVTDRLLNVK